jgi:TolB-like protein/DNA-binding winged helix-turn-helix (wHTH) protein
MGLPASDEAVRSAPPTALMRFGVYVLDLEQQVLRGRDGRPLRLPPQPYKVLSLLAERSGEVVSREDLRRALWGDGTFVDFERGLNSCVRQVREVLGDSAETPRYLETLPRQGYRFLVPVERLPPTAPPGLPLAAAPAPLAGASSARPIRRRGWGWLASAATLLALGGLVAWRGRESDSRPPAARAKLAILPFVDLVGGADGQRVADGFTEEVIAQLASLDPDRLGVLARTSATALRGETGTELARLGLAYVLEGSVRRSASELRITARLVEAPSGLLLWSTTLERSADDLWGAQEDLGHAVAGWLTARLDLRASADPPSALPAPPAAAQYAYLLGRAALATATDGAAMAAAAQQLERAVALDPSHAGAWTALAELAVQRAFAGPWQPEVAAAAVDAAAGRALVLDPTAARAELARGISALYFRWDLAAARRAFARALELGPGIPAIRHWYAGWFSAVGQHREALAMMRDAADLDPVSLPVLTDVGWFSLFAGDGAAGERACRLASERFPTAPAGWSCLAEVRRGAGDLPGAWAAMRRLQLVRGVAAATLRELDAENPAAALAEVDRRLVDRFASDRTGSLSPDFAAAAALRLGDREDALAWLRAAVVHRDPWALFLAVDPRFAALREDPAFVALLGRH